MDNLGFLIASNFVIKIKKLLEKARKIILDWGIYNAINYNISKTKAILFFKTRK